jgi:hypothetical protein
VQHQPGIVHPPSWFPLTTSTPSICQDDFQDTGLFLISVTVMDVVVLVAIREISGYLGTNHPTIDHTLMIVIFTID